MKSKWIACLMAAMLIVTAPAAAKNKGTQTILDNWGSVTVPQNIYMEAGTQPTLAAQEADNDMAAYIAEVLPANTPRTYQIVKMDQGVFQYAYMLHYTLSAAEVRSLIGTDGMSVTAANDALRQRLPRGFIWLMLLRNIRATERFSIRAQWSEISLSTGTGLSNGCIFLPGSTARTRKRRSL